MKKCVLQTVVYSLFQARLFDEPQLASLCLENIDKNTGDALAAEGFTDIDLGNVVYRHCHYCSMYFRTITELTVDISYHP